MKRKRNRIHYVVLTVMVIAMGCASRSALAEYWPQFVAEYAGDTLWALMVFLGLGFLFPTLRTVIIACVVLVFAFGVEFSQLYHAVWIDSFRNTFLGAVILGSGFLWSDFVCYTVGCGIGIVGEYALSRIDEENNYELDA